MTKKDFENLLIEAVDEGLSSLGESSKQAILFHLDKGFNIGKNEIPNKIEDFTKAIEKIFGPGASFLQILIARRLYEKVGEVFESHESADFVFTKHVELVKQIFQKKERIETEEVLVVRRETEIEI